MAARLKDRLAETFFVVAGWLDEELAIDEENFFHNLRISGSTAAGGVEF